MHNIKKIPKKSLFLLSLTMVTQTGCIHRGEFTGDKTLLNEEFPSAFCIKTHGNAIAKLREEKQRMQLGLPPKQINPNACPEK